MTALSPRVYVTGSDIDRATAVIRELRRRGATIVHDWPAETRSRASDDDRRPRAVRDAANARPRLQAVATADVVLCLAGPGIDHERGAALLRLIRGEPVRVLLSGPLPKAERDVWDALCERVQFDGEAIRSITSGLLTVPSLVHDICTIAQHVLYEGRGYLRPDDEASVRECLARANELQELPLSPGDAECWLLCRSMLTILRAGNGYLREIERQALAQEVALAFEAVDRECHLSRLPAARATVRPTPGPRRVRSIADRRKYQERRMTTHTRWWLTMPPGSTRWSAQQWHQQATILELACMARAAAVKTRRGSARRIMRKRAIRCWLAATEYRRQARAQT